MTDDLHLVRIVGFPLPIFRQAQEHTDELLREFSLIALRDEDHHDPTVPRRLLELVKVLTRDFGGLSDAVDHERDAALDAGLDSVDLTYHVPAGVGEAGSALGAMLDEADEFCRSGDALLTLATPTQAKQFRDWYLQEFARQLAGGEPTPWPEYQAAQDRP